MAIDVASSPSPPLLSLYREDDGGSEKGNERRLRRARYRIVQLLAPLLTFFVLIGVVVFGGRSSKNDNDVARSGGNNVAKGEYMTKNVPPSGKYRWTEPHMLPALPDGRGGEDGSSSITGAAANDDSLERMLEKVRADGRSKGNSRSALFMSYRGKTWDWNDARLNSGPKVDYTKWKYSYPSLPDDGSALPPPASSYPPLRPLSQILSDWPQDDIDNPPPVINEGLLHFDYQIAEQRDLALRLRNAEVPFKVYNVPEISTATQKWTDTYLATQFDRRRHRGVGYLWQGTSNDDEPLPPAPPANGHCQVSPDNFFPFFQKYLWYVPIMGPPPVYDTDVTFEQWAEHARYADSTGLEAWERHYYWQSGVPKTERLRGREEWTFVSRDLPSFSDRGETFFGFSPGDQKGIQCRFGERGVTAATHYDGGRNMVAMVTGAKRYILSPPNECSKLGIVTHREHPEFRHSMLNFGHLNILLNETSPDAKAMPPKEREWLKIAARSKAVSTVLKAGEVLYIPSYWFHYIISLQKSAQCNTRSGRGTLRSEEFGGLEDVERCR